MRECTEGGRWHWGSGLAPVGVPPRPLWALVPRCLCLHTLGERQLPLNSHAMTAARRDHVICDLVLNNSVSLLKFTVPPAFLGPSPQGEAGWALGTGPGGGRAAIGFARQRLCARLTPKQRWREGPRVPIRVCSARSSLPLETTKTSAFPFADPHRAWDLGTVHLKDKCFPDFGCPRT